MILVAGGTGRLGSLVVPRLQHAGRPVRVLTRRAPRSAYEVQGDLRLPETLRAALDGVNIAVAAANGLVGDRKTSPDTVDAQGNVNLIEAAVAAGVEHLVLMSIYRAAPDHPLELFRAKHQAEVALRACGLRHTIIRPTAFAELWLSRLRSTPIVGSGTNPINFVSVHDVADAAVDAVLERRSGDYDLGGPDNLCLDELAGLAGLHPKHVPRAAGRAGGLLLRLLNPSVARLLRMAVVMDTEDMTFPNGEGTSVHEVIGREHLQTS